MIEGVLWLVVANVAVLGVTNTIHQRVRTGRGELDAVLFLLIRLTLIDATILLAGLAGILTAQWLGLIGVAALIATFRHLPRPRLPNVGPIMGVAAAIVFVRLLLQAWFFAPYTTDVLTYHLPKLAEWIRAGQFVRQLGVDSHAAFPGGHELLQTWWVVFLHHDIIIEMAGVEMLILAATATYALARWIGISLRWAAFAAFLFAMTPGMQLEATSCLNDDAVCALVLSTFVLVVYRAPLGFLAMLAGIGAGVKGSYLYALPGPIALWAWDAWRSDTEGKSARDMLKLKDPAPLLLGAVGLIVGAYWYLRNWAWFGSPIYPMNVEGKGLIESSGHRAVSFGADFSGFKANLFDLIDRAILDSARPYSGLSTDVSGWGAVAFACGLVALVVALQREAKFRRLALGFLFTFLSMLLFIINAPWFTRFFFFVPALLAVASAWLAQNNRWVLLVAVPALMLEFAGTMMPDEIPFSQVEMLMREPWRQRSVANHYDAVYKGDAMGYYAEDHGEAYFLYRPDYSGRVAYLRALDPYDLIKEMREKNVTELYAVPGTMERVRVLQQAVNEGLLRRISKRFYVMR